MTASAAVQHYPAPSPQFIARFRGASAQSIAEHFATRTDPRLFACVEAEVATPQWTEAALAGNFTFVGETHCLPEPIDWFDNPSSDVEWHIALHKFYQAPAFAQAWRATGDRRCRDVCLAQIASWIEQVPHDHIAADVTARRIQNWIYALHLLSGGGAPPLDPDFLLLLLQSIEMQVEWLLDHLHPARNHRTLELYAIFLAGVGLPELQAAASWRERALSDLALNALADFLPDGVHCELSTHYHCIALRNFVHALKLARMNGIAVPATMEQRLRLARDFARAITKPDGTIPAIGDADVGDYRPMLDQADDLLGPSENSGRLFFPDGGYYLQRGEPLAGEADCDGRYLIFDCGPVGAGNHGHLDCLSVEIAAAGRSLIVDPGRFSYNEGGAVNWRKRFRETAAHSTVQVDGTDQTAYRMKGSRFRICGPAPSAEILHAAPDYFHGRARSVEYDAVHDRHIWFLHQRYWLILDQLTAPQAHRYDLRYQLSAEAEGSARAAAGHDGGEVATPVLQMILRCGTPAALSIDEGWVSPAYGIKYPAPVVRCHSQASRTWFATLIVPGSEDASDISLEPRDAHLSVSVNGVTDRIPFPCWSGQA